MKSTNETTYEIAYLTRTGKPCRKEVPASRIPAVWARLEEQGCYDCRVSCHPLSEGTS